MAQFFVFDRMSSKISLDASPKASLGISTIGSS